MSSIQFSAKRKIEVVLDAYSVQQVEEQVNTEQLMKILAVQEYEKGYNQCMEDLESKNQERIENEMHLLKESSESVLNTINQELLLIEKDLPKTILNISLAIAEKIIRREVELSSNIRLLIEESLKKIVGAAEVTVKINSEDLKILDNQFTNIKLYGDDSIERGGCQVETEIGNIDAKVNSQLSEIKRSIETILFER